MGLTERMRCIEIPALGNCFPIPIENSRIGTALNEVIADCAVVSQSGKVEGCEAATRSSRGRFLSAVGRGQSPLINTKPPHIFFSPMTSAVYFTLVPLANL